MLNDLHGPDEQFNGDREPVRRSPNGGSPLSDREVPLTPHRTPAVVQAWLDGEVSMAEAMRGDGARDVEFWNKLNEQAEERRHMRTPVHVQQRILEAIPKGTPIVESRWIQRDSHMSNGLLLVLGAAMIGLGVLATMLLA